MSRVLVVLAALALACNALIDPQLTYQFYPQLTLGGAGNPQNNNNDYGRAWLVYTPTTKTLSYQLFTNIGGGYTSAALMGPFTCCSIPAPGQYGFPNCNPFNLGSVSCQYNNATQQFALGVGPVYDKSSVVLTASQEEMLFSMNLYIVVRSTIYPNGHLAGLIFPDMYTPTGEGAAQQRSFYNIINLVPNTNNLFPNEQPSSSTAVGFGLIAYTPYLLDNNNAQHIFVEVWHSVKDPGAVSMSCSNVKPSTISFTRTGTSPVIQTIQMYPTTGQTTSYTNSFAEMYISGNCYVSILSGAYPNGELFGYLYRYGHLEFIAVGANEQTNPNNNDLISCMADWDAATKILGFICYSNVTTDSITSLSVVDSVTTMTLCTVAGVAPGAGNPEFPTTAPTTTPYLTVPPVWFCPINSTYVNSVYTGKLYLQVVTSSTPNGAALGYGILNTKAAGTAAPQGLSVGAQVAIGVIVGIVGLALIVVVIVVLVKKDIIRFGGKRI